MKQKASNKPKTSGTVFLPIVLVLYVIIYIFSPEKTVDALGVSFNTMLKLLPIIITVMILLGVFNYFFNLNKLAKKMDKNSGAKAWIYALVGGIISHGPTYIWYPMLSEFRSHGVRDGLIFAFFYTRSIKVPMLPIMIDYFGWGFTILLSFYTIVAALVQGIIMNALSSDEVENQTSP